MKTEPDTGARANDHICHVSCCCTPRASCGRVSPVTFAKMKPILQAALLIVCCTCLCAKSVWPLPQKRNLSGYWLSTGEGALVVVELNEKGLSYCSTFTSEDLPVAYSFSWLVTERKLYCYDVQKSDGTATDLTLDAALTAYSWYSITLILNASFLPNGKRVVELQPLKDGKHLHLALDAIKNMRGKRANRVAGGN